MGELPHRASSFRCSYAASNDQRQIKEQSARITPVPELRVRQNDCAQISQSASQAVQQASQQAAQSVQQASQQASQSVQQAAQQASQTVRQASQSATQAIQQAQQSATQLIAAASRSVSSISSSASSVMSSVQASAASAIFRANLAMQSAQLSASIAQAKASNAVIGAQTPQGVAGSTQGNSAPSSHAASITPAQLAVAIIVSVIASTIITILAYFFINRHRQAASSSSSKLSSDDITSEKEFYASNGLPRRTPADPPNSPSLRSWLKHQSHVSPFGSLQIPVEHSSQGPLQGQPKSPVQAPSKSTGPQPPRFMLDVSLGKDTSAYTPAVAGLISNRDFAQPKPKRSKSSKSTTRPSRYPSTRQPPRESKASVWTAALSDYGSTVAPASPEPIPRTQTATGMTLLSPNGSVPNTAVWLAENANFRSPIPESNTRSPRQNLDERRSRVSSATGGLPSNPRDRRGPGSGQWVGSMQSENGYVPGGFLDPKGRGQIKGGKEERPRTPGVGKAM